MARSKKHNPLPLDTYKSWIVMFSTSLLFLYSYFALNVFNPIEEMVAQEFTLSPGGMGLLSSLYFIGSFIILIPAGLMLDRFSSRKIILVAMLLSIISMFGLAFSHYILTAQFFRFLAGIAGGISFVSCIRIASRWFSNKKIALVTGFVVATGMVGGMIAQTPVIMLVEKLGWRLMLVISGIVGIYFIIWMFFYVKDWPRLWEEKEERKKIQKLGFFTSIAIVIKNYSNFLCGIYTALINLPIFVLGALFGQVYFVQGHKIDVIKSSFIMVALFAGATIASPMMGMVADYFKRRKVVMLISSFISLVIAIVIMVVPTLSFTLSIILFFVLGVMAATQTISYSIVTSINSPLVTGFAISIVSMILIASGFIFQPMCGYLIQKGSFAVTNYSLIDYHRALMVLPIGYVVSFVVAIFIKEKKYM
jgi:MFS family permease